MISITDSNFPTVESRLEKFYSWVDHACNYLKRGVELDARGHNIIAIKNWDKPGLREWYFTHNLATDQADLFYAEQAVNATLTNDFLSANNRCELGNPATNDTIAKDDAYGDLGSPITASRKAITSGYPKLNDDDPLNTGAGADIASWDYEWLTTDFNTESANDIRSGVIHLGGASPVAGTVLLTHYNFASPFEKTSDDTLKVFHNHRFNGV